MRPAVGGSGGGGAWSRAWSHHARPLGMLTHLFGSIISGRGDAAVRGGERVCTAAGSQGAHEHLVPLLSVAGVGKGVSQEGANEATLKDPLRNMSVLAFLDRFVESYVEAAASANQEEAGCSDQEAATRHSLGSPVEQGTARTSTDTSRNSDDAFSFSGLDWNASTSGSATPLSGSETGLYSSGDDEHYDKHGAPSWLEEHRNVPPASLDAEERGGGRRGGERGEEGGGGGRGERGGGERGGEATDARESSTVEHNAEELKSATDAREKKWGAEMCVGGGLHVTQSSAGDTPPHGVSHSTPESGVGQGVERRSAGEGREGVGGGSRPNPLSLPPVGLGLPGRERGGAREAVGTNSKTRDGGGLPDSVARRSGGCGGDWGGAGDRCEGVGCGTPHGGGTGAGAAGGGDGKRGQSIEVRTPSSWTQTWLNFSLNSALTYSLSLNPDLANACSDLKPCWTSL